MPSLRTIYRAVVMLVVGTIVVKGWQLYGPSAEQVKSTVVSAIDKAEAAWKNWQPPQGERTPAADSHGATPFAKAAPPAADSESPVAPPLTQSNAGGAPADASVGNPIQQVGQATITPSAETRSQTSTANDNRLPALLSRLEQLGVTEPKLAPWGSGGELYRFCCRAAVTESPAFARHFESVAAEPTLAVEQVVAKVEAWRTAQRNNTLLR